jgi:hypothetical protein
MRQGMTGAERSAATAARSLEKVENEITEQTAQVTTGSMPPANIWVMVAKTRPATT